MSFVWVFKKPHSEDITMLPLPPEKTQDSFDFIELVNLFVPNYITYFLRRLEGAFKLTVAK